MKDNLEVETYNLEKLKLYKDFENILKADIRQEAVALIKESRDYIVSMRADIQTLKKENEEIKSDCFEMAEILNEKFKELENNDNK